MAAQGQGGLTGGARARVLLAPLILSWAISWPAIKVGVATVPPVWYAPGRAAVLAFSTPIWVASSLHAEDAKQVPAYAALALTLGEPIGVGLIAGVVLIAAGICLASGPPKSGATMAGLRPSRAPTSIGLRPAIPASDDPRHPACG